ncbi:DNA polymerase IV [Flaviflexus huanghaiensis]|uniref:DNA polymerase IV n=1 Tax=Flaviflexus huanghaiensis TaxID=1111473 RepID=UPI0015FA059E|nr:DNA polymerase IV [Flaviflexus huanghaiensis]
MSRGPRSASARRPLGSDDSHTPILHVDMDAFFVEVELLERPHLRGLPVAVGGAERGVVTSASYEARAFGVNSAMPVAQAKRLCPDLIMIPVRHGVYSAVARRVMEILSSFTPLLEQVSVDEAFLDVSGDRRRTPVEIGHLIRQEIRKREGVPASVGIAATKHVAKIASAHAKPDGLLLVPKDETEAFLGELPLGALWGVGEATKRRLEQRGIRSVADVRELSQDSLERVLGKSGGMLWRLANGIDPRPVVTSRVEKSIGREETSFDLLNDPAQVRARILDQSHECARRLRQRSLVAWRVSIKVRDSSFTTITRSHTLQAPTNLAHEIYRVASSLLEMPGGGVRLIGVRVENLEAGDSGQATLDDDGRTEQAERALDTIRNRFGQGAVGPGTLLSGTDSERL